MTIRRGRTWVAVLVLAMVAAVLVTPRGESSMEPQTSAEADCCIDLGHLQAAIEHAMNLSLAEDRPAARSVIKEALAQTGMSCEYVTEKGEPRFRCRRTR